MPFTIHRTPPFKMEAFYIVLFAALAALAALLETGRGRSSGGALTRDFVAFRNNYVLVYALMMGEWGVGV